MTELLSRFDVEVLVAVAENPMAKGMDIINALEDRLGMQIQHSRTYPRLDKLDNLGLIHKHEKHHDNRTHAYEITTNGIQTLEELEETIQNGLERSYEQ